MGSGPNPDFPSQGSAWQHHCCTSQVAFAVAPPLWAPHVGGSGLIRAW